MITIYALVTVIVVGSEVMSIPDGLSVYNSKQECEKQ